MSAVRVEIRSEIGTSHEPAHVRVFDGKNLIAEVIATIEPRPGADGGLYPCIILEKK